MSDPRAGLNDPERIGRYRIVRPLSKGGMALVYEARRESLAGVSPRVAIKVIIPDYASSDQFQELFINEARLGAQLHHQNLVQIQDFDRDGDKFFLVMEYVEGFTLRRLVTQCYHHKLMIPLDTLCEIGRQACDGLDYAHKAHDEQGRHLGLVHRDVKPSNIVLNPQGVVKILDFGISKGRLVREKKGSVKGTWGYMAPEQANGLEVGPPADVFGLATVLYELAAKRPLFEQRAPEDIKRLLDDDHAVRMAATLDPSYGPLVPVLMRALQRDPNSRYPAAGDFGRALSELMVSPITARDELVRFYEYIHALDTGRPPGRAPGTGSGVGDGAQGSQVPSQASLAASQSPSTPEPAGFASLAVAGVLVGAAVLVMAGTIVLGGVGVAWYTQPEAPVAEAPPTAEAKPAADEPPGPAAEGAPESPPPAALRTDPKRPSPSGAGKPKPEAPAAAPAEKPPEEASFVVKRVKEPEVVEAKVTPKAAEPPPPPPEIALGTGMLSVSATGTGKFEVWVDGKLVNKGAIAKMEFPATKHVVSITAEDGRTKTFEVDLKPDQYVMKIWDFDTSTWRR